MNQNETKKIIDNLDRRDFLKGGSMTALISMLGGVELTAPAQDAAPKPAAFKVNVAVIGLGPWGREIAQTLVKIPEANLVAVCDTYSAMLRRMRRAAPDAKKVEDYHEILADKSIQAVCIATGSHQHKQIVLEALKSGKHVYVEAPVANSIADARTIAKAGRDAYSQVFQTGLNYRSDPQRHFILDFFWSGAAGNTVMSRAQWHKKTSWRYASPNRDREQSINWRLRKQDSPGLVGEMGIQQIDNNSWFHKRLPTAVTGFGDILHYQDGRTVPDTIQAIFEYPGKGNFIYDAALTNSFDSDYEMIYGTYAAIMMRGKRAWMFKEVDSPLLGWEVYARKDTFYNETGIALVANATKLVAARDEVAQDEPYTNTPLSHSMRAFLHNANETGNAVNNFKETFGFLDKDSVLDYLKTLNLKPAAGFQEGFEATVTVLKANEAVNSKKRIEYDPAWFKV
ncbi:MAG: putative dehydrogenase [Limisphaerales bacterium]|jgi:predicted dehydrogenase